MMRQTTPHANCAAGTGCANAPGAGDKIPAPLLLSPFPDPIPMTDALQPRELRIATRESALAMWQAEHIRARLAATYPQCKVGLVGFTTQGDRILDQPLADIGGKGLFIKELEVAMAEGRADLAVHSLKDVPMDMPEGFTLAAITAREDPRDAFVSNHYLDLGQLPGGARVGTSSLRREAQLRERDPLLSIEPLRGNVNTRLRKLDEGRYDAIILAAAGLKRLGFGNRIARLLDPDESLPAVGQGALALECRADRPDVIAALAPFADAETTLATTAERAFSRALAGSCHTPLAAHAVARHGNLWLRRLLASRDGKEVMRGECEAAIADAAAADALGRALAQDFLARGAARLVADAA
jgi:hydroxymethylbilane synthase